MGGGGIGGNEMGAGEDILKDRDGCIGGSVSDSGRGVVLMSVKVVTMQAVVQGSSFRNG